MNPMFVPYNLDGYAETLPGVRQKTLAYGDKTLMVEFLLTQGSILPIHKHPYEQTGYLVRGHIRLTIGGQKFDTRPGDSWTVPANVEHGAEPLEDSAAVEVFSPVRTDYL